MKHGNHLCNLTYFRKILAEEILHPQESSKRFVDYAKKLRELDSDVFFKELRKKYVKGTASKMKERKNFLGPQKKVSFRVPGASLRYLELLNFFLANFFQKNIL